MSLQTFLLHRLPEPAWQSLKTYQIASYHPVKTLRIPSIISP